MPRWGGDNNFMPVIADTKVMPQTIEQSYAALKGALSEQLTPPGIFKAYDIRGLYGEEMDEGDGARRSAAPSPACWPAARQGSRPSCGSASAATCG